MEHIRSILREFKIYGVILFVVGTVWAVAWSAEEDEQVDHIRFWARPQPRFEEMQARWAALDDAAGDVVPAE
ncbi:MAG TPA: hypothetical protein VH475_10345 [Tepidisphaeraceae bacterium]